MKEILRISNISVPDDKGSGLHNFSLNIRVGEILGILGNRYAGKGKVRSIMTAEAIPEFGTLFWDGKKCDFLSWPAIAARCVLSLSQEWRLIDGLTVWENVSILWERSSRIKERNHHKLYRMIELLFQEYGLKLKLNKKVEALTRIEKLTLEMVALRHQKTALIIIDSFEIEGTTKQLEDFKALLEKMKAEGISFVVFCHQLSVLPNLVDRIAFLNKGRNIKILDWKHADACAGHQFPMGIGDNNWSLNFREEAEELIRNLYGEKQYPERIYRTAGQAVLSVEDLDIQSGKTFSLVLYPGEFTALVTPSLKIYEVLQKQMIGKELLKNVIFLDMNYLDELIDELSPIENLCLGLYDKMSVWGFEKRSRLKCVQDEFYEWYGHQGLLAKKDSKSLYRQERIALNLFRLKLARKKVIFCTDFNQHNDLQTNNMVRRTLIELLTEGASICMITGDLEYSDEMVDHFILLENS